MADESEPQLPDMGALLGMAFDMQQQLAAAQEEAARSVVEGQAGGGAVRIEVTGDYRFRSVTISPDAVDPDDVELLQDLVLAALHEAVAAVRQLHEDANPLAGLGLGGGLGDALGGAGLTGGSGVPGLPGLPDLGGFDLTSVAGVVAAEDLDDLDEGPGDDGYDLDDFDEGPSPVVVDEYVQIVEVDEPGSGSGPGDAGGPTPPHA